jgi:hypothetical protein
LWIHSTDTGAFLDYFVREGEVCSEYINEICTGPLIIVLYIADTAVSLLSMRLSIYYYSGKWALAGFSPLSNWGYDAEVGLVGRRGRQTLVNKDGVA